MALVLKDRVRESTATTGTGTLSLDGAITGFQGFSVIGNTNTTYYAVVDVTTGDWEVGLGTYTSAGSLLSRDTVLESSSGGTKINFGAGPKDVFCTYPAEQAVTLTDVQTLTNKTLSTGTAITAGTINGATIGASTASTGAFTTLSATGVTTVQAGTVSAPAITTTGDTNTGIFFPAADTIAFAEGGVEAMRIDSAGNVGIGTISPTRKLSVDGAGVFNFTSGSIEIAEPGTVPGFSLQTSTANQRTDIRNTAGNLVFTTGTGSTTERMRITSTGNVGIGTSSPGSLLDVNGGIVSRASGGEGGEIAFNNPDNASVGLTVDVSAADTGRVFQARNNSVLQIGQLAGTGGIVTLHTATAERMRITSAGNVGIGTNAPAERLHVKSSAAAAGVIQLGDTATTGYYSQINQSDNDLRIIANGDQAYRVSLGTNNGSGSITFQTANGTTGNTERARINSSGNLLVGTTSAAGTLTVAGGSFATAVAQLTKPNGVANCIVINSGSTLSDPAILVQGNGVSKAYWLHDGEIYLPGGAAGVKTFSDKRLKKDVAYLSDPTVAGYKGLATLTALKPVTFRFKTDDDASPLRRGWIADDFAEQMPELVTENKIPGGDGIAYKSVADGGLIPVLVAAIQELKAELDTVKAELQTLKGQA
jgi:hypothetical protein